MMYAQPRGLSTLFFCEMWERFSYYGMRALLLLYMVQFMELGVAQAGQIYGMYTGLIYLTPTLGGYLADRYLGQGRAIIIGGLLMAAGHFLLILQSFIAFVAALVLLICGCGLFKPNVSVLVGRLYAPDDPRREAAFGTFYMGINLGAFISPLICGSLGQRLGWHWGFGCAGIGMLIGLVVFVSGQKELARSIAAAAGPSARAFGTGPSRITQPTALDETSAVAQLSVPAAGAPVCSGAEARQRLLVLLALAAFGQVVFWAVFEQAGSSLAIFAEDSVRLDVWGGAWHMPSTWFQAANPLFIALLTPLLARGWLALARHNREPEVPWKFVLGLLCLSGGFVIMARAGAAADCVGRVSPLWLLSAYFCNTLGELCISPTGLSTVTRLAPPRHLSLTMGGWLAAMALGNFLAGELASTYQAMHRAHFFSVAAMMALASGVLLALLAPTLSRRIQRLTASRTQATH